jgi:hypothetical protein
MNIRKYYMEAFPTDELGVEIKPNAHFAGLLIQLMMNGDVYKYIGVSDSLVRERCFQKLAEIWGVEYDFIYSWWLTPQN